MFKKLKRYYTDELVGVYNIYEDTIARGYNGVGPFNCDKCYHATVKIKAYVEEHRYKGETHYLLKIFYDVDSDLPSWWESKIDELKTILNTRADQKFYEFKADIINRN